MIDLVTRAELDITSASAVVLVVRTKLRLARQASTFCEDQSTNVWFPTAPGAALPAAPNPTTNPNPAPPSSTPLLPDVDLNDTCFVFQDLLPIGSAPVYATELDPVAVLPPYSENIPLLGVTVSALSIQQYPYNLTLSAASLSLITKSALTVVTSDGGGGGGGSEPVFGVVYYTGNGTTTNAVTGLGFQPGLVWTKRLDSNGDHLIFSPQFHNVFGGTNYAMVFNGYTDEDASVYCTFDADGFTLKTTKNNINAGEYIAFGWQASGTAATNTNGSITTSVLANQALELSVFTYTGTGATGTIGHGLSGAPDILFVQDQANGMWVVAGGTVVGANYTLSGDFSGPRDNDTGSFTAFSASTVSLGSSYAVNESGGHYTGFAFKSKVGISKVGTFSGSAAPINVTGLGFQPQWLMIKNLTGGFADWGVFVDGLAGLTEPTGYLYADLDSGVQEPSSTTFGSDGFTYNGTEYNDTGVTYIYIAFA